MIRNITGTNGIIVKGMTSANYVGRSYNNSPSTGTPATGALTYDFDQQCVSVYTGYNWVPWTGGHAEVTFDDETKTLLEWAKKKRQEENERDILAQTNPTIKDLINQIKEKEHQILMVQQLLKEEEKVESN